MVSLLSAPLQAFLAVIRNGSVHGAARALSLTQTGITQRIRSLETSLGTTLFLRSRKGMVPTSDGLSLLRYCENTQGYEGEFWAQLGGGKGTGTQRITIQGPTSIMRSRIIPSCSNVLPEFLNLRISFQINDGALQGATLKSGQTDLEIMEPVHVVNEFESRMLKPEKYVLVGPQKWKGRRTKDIVRDEVIIDFDASDAMTFKYLDFAGYSDLARKDRHFVNNTESLSALISDGHGYGVLSLEFAAPFLENKDLVLLNNGLAMEHRCALAWYRRPTMPAWFDQILKSIK
jgi:LysR family transcriptional regulator, chromosome initiation inhibitor